MATPNDRRTQATGTILAAIVNAKARCAACPLFLNGCIDHDKTRTKEHGCQVAIATEPAREDLFATLATITSEDWQKACELVPNQHVKQAAENIEDERRTNTVNEALSHSDIHRVIARFIQDDPYILADAVELAQREAAYFKQSGR